MDEPQAKEARTEKKSSGWLVKLLITLVVLAGLGGGAVWYLHGNKAEAASEPPLESRGLLTFEPFLVNLTDAGGNRFLKANIGLVLETAEEAAHVQETPVLVSHLRSAILELLTQQSAPALVTPEGKEALKNAIKERTGPILRKQKVLDVVFSEFVVQF